MSRNERPSRVPELTIAISTIGGRAARIELPDPVRGVRYLLLVQRARQAGPLPTRADLQVVHLPSVGISHSRNAALDHTATPYLMFADDDITLEMEGVLRLLSALHADRGITLATGHLAGRGRRRQPHKLRSWNTGRLNSSEMMVRLKDVRRSGVRFDRNFGLGAANGLGEEYIFAADLLAAGLRGHHFPITTAHHPHQSTGLNWSDTALHRARIRVLARVFGRLAPLARLGFAFKNIRLLARAPGGALRFVLGRVD